MWAVGVRPTMDTFTLIILLEKRKVNARNVIKFDDDDSTAILVGGPSKQNF
jgi:hypothetical protein